MKICTNAKIYDVQNDKALGFIVSRNGRIVARGSNAYEAAVSVFKMKIEDNAYAAREATARA